MMSNKALRHLPVLGLFVSLFLGQTHYQALSDTTSGYWSVKAPLPIPWATNAVVVHDGFLYSFGSDSNYRYDPSSNAWMALPPPPYSNDFPSDACLGFNAQGQVVIVIFPSEAYQPILAYNITRNRWEQRSVPAPLPSTFFEQDIASDTENNICYITGGQAGADYRNTLYAYYPATNTAQQLSGFTTQRAYHASWFVPQWGEAGYVCIAGGYYYGANPTISTQCFDVVQGIWLNENTNLGSLPYYLVLGADALTVTDGKPRPWLLGGVLNGYETNLAMYYDVDLGAWVEGIRMPYAVADMEGDAIGNEIYVVGGSYMDPQWKLADYTQHYLPQPLPPCMETAVFFDDFEGPSQWIPSGDNNLWHTELQSDACGSLVAPFPSPETTWYFGDQEYGCTYDQYPLSSIGYLTLDTMIPISGAHYATIRFWSDEQTECGEDTYCVADFRFLDVSYNEGIDWTHLWRGGIEGSWYPVAVSTHLDPGDNLNVRFYFNSTGAYYNDYLGWFIDNVEVTGCFEQPTQTWFEEDDPTIAYSGLWKSLACPECSGGAQKAAAQRGATAEFTFTGTGIRWYLTKANLLGKARVVLDGVDLSFVDLFSPTPQYQQVWEKTDLSPGAHTLKIEVSGKKNPRSRGRAITLDALEVVP
jgi:hypothetical protein